MTAAYGTEGFTPDHLAAFKKYSTERVLIAYDRDEAGDRAAEKLAAKLMAKGIDCWRIQFPKGMDANEYAQKVQPAAKSLGLAIRNAMWMGHGTPPDPGPNGADRSMGGPEAAKKGTTQKPPLAQGGSAPEAVPSSTAAPQAPPEAVPSQVPEAPVEEPVPAPVLPASPKPSAPGDDLPVEVVGTRSRRDHVKYLTLIRSIALLHQFQCDVKTHGDLRYIEVIPQDIELANELAQEVLDRTMDELLPQTRKLLILLHAWVKAECERQSLVQGDFTFTRRQAREAIGWGDSQLKVHLDRLMELEFLLAHRGRQGQGYLYELLYQGEDAEGRARLLGLLDFARLKPVVTTATSRGSEATSRGASGKPEPNGDEVSSPILPLNGAKPRSSPLAAAPVLSYPHVVS